MKAKASIGEYTVIRKDNDAIEVYKSFKNTVIGLQEVYNYLGKEYNPKQANARKYGDVLLGADSSCEVYGQYIVSREESEAYKVARLFYNTKSALRDISTMISFSFDVKWNTQRFGRELIAYINEGESTELKAALKRYKEESIKEKSLQAQDQVINNSSLREEVVALIRGFMKDSSNVIFTSEAHLQHEMALYFNQNDITTMLEHYVPRLEGQEDGKSNYVDIVAVRGNVYVPIELKYRLTSGKNMEVSVSFNVENKDDSMGNNGGNNNARKGVWQDVWRNEQIVAKYNGKQSVVEQGIAVLLTNSKALWSDCKTDVGYAQFSLSDKRGNVTGLIT